MKLSKKTLIISASTFFVIALLGGVVLVTNNFNVDLEDSKDSNASSLVEKTETDSSADTDTPDVTSDSSEDTEKMTKETTTKTDSSVVDVMKK
jgi:hypothetical protein